MGLVNSRIQVVSVVILLASFFVSIVLALTGLRVGLYLTIYIICLSVGGSLAHLATRSDPRGDL